MTIPPLIHIATAPGTIRPDEVDGVVVAAELDIKRRVTATFPRLEAAVVKRILSDVPAADLPPTVAAVDDAASGDPETAYSVLWVERSAARRVGDPAAGMGESRPDVEETCLIWMRVQRGDADRAYGFILAAVNALVEPVTVYTYDVLPPDNVDDPLVVPLP